ncbi:MAG: hypothetical protein NTX61_09590 [Bacteroidetes bacterium]|nr:hypothetical protein [Bacteroidota bacterium]
MSKSICSGESTNILIQSDLPGLTFHWTASLTSGNVTGYTPDSGLVINQVLVNSLLTPGIVTYHITPKAGSCAGPTVDFPVTVNPAGMVSVNISASANNICEGTSITFTAIPVNGGTNPVYQWLVNGGGVWPNALTITYTPTNGDQISCILNSSAICASGNPAIAGIGTKTIT